jgi:hypothetical protein
MRAGALATLLPLLERLARNPEGSRIDAFDGAGERLVSYAHELRSTGLASGLRDLTLDEAVSCLWSDLLKLGDAVY